MSSKKKSIQPEIIPASFATYTNLQDLIEILGEKAHLLRTLKPFDFGKRVRNADEATALLNQIANLTHEALGLHNCVPKKPCLVLTEKLTKLPAITLRLYLVYLPISLLLLYIVFSVPTGSLAFLIALAAVILVLAVPYLAYRRTRLNLEHSCKYRRGATNRAVIEIDQLRKIQFQSYLTHEYAHHLYYELGGRSDEAWLREGWARLVQWHVMQRLYRSEENSAFLHHVLLQIVGELKFACIVLSSILRVRLPSKVRRIRTIYRNDPFYRLLTGTPGFNLQSLTRHAVGTASCFLAERREGPDRALRESLQKPFGASH
ncbi:MAG: hypothetical protein RBS57_06430 [Desulforhabdus sp.]|jgi:hypothetical protein|nr:hypothetical protein [Desulforhabdus sp.]